jgi:hypothetical protein
MSRRIAKSSAVKQTPFIRTRICRNPIFIIGSPRSGTSILAWSLAQHSKLWCSQESDFLYYLFGDDCINVAYRTGMVRPDGNWLQATKVEQAEFQKYAGLGMNALFTSRSRGKRWIDQSPTYTLIPEILAEMFPGAFFVHMLRDGRKTVHSMIHSGFDMPWAKDFAEACRTWRTYVEKALNFSRRFPERSLTVTNEAIAKKPGESFEKILSFIGAEHQQAPAKFFRCNRINSSFSTPREIGSANGARSPRAWDDWSDDQRRIFVEEAGATLVRCGFAAAKELGLEQANANGELGSGLRRQLDAGERTSEGVESETIHGLRKALAEQSAWAQRSAGEVITRDHIIRSLQEQLDRQSASAQQAADEAATRDAIICSLQEQLRAQTGWAEVNADRSDRCNGALRGFEQQRVPLIATR